MFRQKPKSSKKATTHGFQFYTKCLETKPHIGIKQYENWEKIC